MSSIFASPLPMNRMPPHGQTDHVFAPLVCDTTTQQETAQTFARFVHGLCRWHSWANMGQHRMPDGLLSPGIPPYLDVAPQPPKHFMLTWGPETPTWHKLGASAAVAAIGQPTTTYRTPFETMRKPDDGEQTRDPEHVQRNLKAFLKMPLGRRPRHLAIALEPAETTVPAPAPPPTRQRTAVEQRRVDVLGSLHMMLPTPSEREVNVKSDLSGRVLTEIEALQRQHAPAFAHIVPVVCAALRKITAEHEAELRAQTNTPGDLDMTMPEVYREYQTHAVPPIELNEYIRRLGEHTHVSPASMIGALILMDRLLGRHPVLHIIWLNVYKIFFIALRIASKVIDIRTLNNKNFASVGGITLRHLNEMEVRMLQDLHFDTYISPRDILEYSARAFPIGSGPRAGAVFSTSTMDMRALSPLKPTLAVLATAVASYHE